MSWANDSCCHFSEGTISSRSTEDSSWHFISKCSFRHRHNNASPHYHWMTNVCKMCFGLSLQLKYMHSFPFLHLHWLRGRADVPWSHPHGTLTPSCHSNDNSFSYHHDSCCTPDRLAGPGQPHHSLAQPPIHLYLYCQFCKFHFPIISTPPPIIIPASTSLSLICFFYSLSDLSLPFQRNLLLFTASTSPANCQLQLFFFCLTCKTLYSMSSTDVLRRSEFESDGLIKITVCGAHLHYFSRVLFNQCKTRTGDLGFDIKFSVSTSISFLPFLQLILQTETLVSRACKG